MKVKITVCELQDNSTDLVQEWQRLIAHVKAASSDVILLPEMPFYPWFARTQPFDSAVWKAAVHAHDVWQKRFNELAPAIVLGSRPVDRHNRRYNEGFIWEQQQGYRIAHHKYYLPDEERFWEASWYHRGDRQFSTIESSNLRLGFLICSELWFMEHARTYGKAGANLIVTPRATEKATVNKWLAGGRTAAVVSGAFSLSSNRAPSEGHPTDFGGQGWVIAPDGEVLGLTSREQPFVTVEIDLHEAERAKQTYPRYILE